MAGFSKIWTPAFGLITKLLYEATKGPDTEPLFWNGEQKKLSKISIKPSPEPLLWVSPA